MRNNDVRYSPIAPVKMLASLHNDYHMLGNYLLLLAHEVLAHPEEYEELVAGIRKVAWLLDNFIIMDNGTVELDTPLSAPLIIKAASIVNADCIVLPDVIGDSVATTTRINKDLGLLKDCGFPLMRVPQGRNLKEIYKCVDWLNINVQAAAPYNYWGIPRWFANSSAVGSRKPVVEYINNNTLAPSIHLLGMSSNLTDDIECCQLPNIIGIDSANPLVMGIYEKVMGRDVYIHMGSAGARKTMWEAWRPDADILHNIKYIRRQISNVDYP